MFCLVGQSSLILLMHRRCLLLQQHLDTRRRTLQERQLSHKLTNSKATGTHQQRSTSRQCPERQQQTAMASGKIFTNSRAICWQISQTSPLSRKSSIVLSHRKSGGKSRANSHTCLSRCKQRLRHFWTNLKVRLVKRTLTMPWQYHRHLTFLLLLPQLPCCSHQCPLQATAERHGIQTSLRRGSLSLSSGSRSRTSVRHLRRRLSLQQQSRRVSQCLNRSHR